MFRYFTIDNFDFKDKVVCIRVDINSPIKNKKVVLNERIKKSAKSIKKLIKKNAKVVVIAHQGRLGKDDCVSLKQHCELLSKELGQKIKFIPEIFSKDVQNKIKAMKSKNVILLENLRFYEEEIDMLRKENRILKLQPLIDFYVFDAFSVAHRKQTSVVGFNKKPCIAGPLMEKEVLGLNSIEKTKKPHVFVFGGAKPDDLVELLEVDLKNQSVDQVILTGVIGEIALHIKGYNIGKKFEFLQEHKFLDSLDKIKKLLEKYQDKILIPKDVALIDKKGKRIEIKVKDLDKNKDLLTQCLIQDIGKESIKNFDLYLRTAGSIYFKGPAGNFEEKNLETGTKGILKSITTGDAFTFMGGGHSVTAADDFGFLNKFSYVSLAGGALVKFLSGQKLPGVINLESSFDRFEGMYEDFIVIGSNSEELVISAPESFQNIHLGDKVKVNDDFKKSIGGGGINVSICLGRLGGNVGYLGKISEENSKFIKEVLDKNKVSVIKTKLSKRPCAKSVLLDTEDGDRVIFTYRGQNSYLELNDFNLKDLHAKNFYFCSLTKNSFDTMYRIAKDMKKSDSKINICYNPPAYLIKKKKSHLKALIKYVDVLVMNYEEAEDLVDCDYGVSDCLRKMKQLGPNVVIITDGTNGSYVYDGKREYYVDAVKPKKVVDTTGAGDTYGGTFFYFYSKGFGIKKSMQLASKNASKVVEFKGAQLGLQYYEDLVKKK